MAKSYNQKVKLLFLMDLFLRKTDQEHTISMKEIIAELEKNGISGARKSIYSDIETLKEYDWNQIIQILKNQKKKTTKHKSMFLNIKSSSPLSD